jgi:hypothetical protein
VEPFVDEGAGIGGAVRHVFHDHVEGVLEHAQMAFLAGGQVQVDQVRGRVVADGVPVLPGPVGPQAVVVRAQGDRVDVRVVAAEPGIGEELLEEPHGVFEVLADHRVTGDPVGLGEPDECVDLLVRGQRAVLVAELGGEELALAQRLLVDAVVPVDDVGGLVVEAQVLVEVAGAGLRDVQVLLLTGEQVGRGHPVHQARDRVGLLDPVRRLLAAAADLGAVGVEVRCAVAELGAAVEAGQDPQLVGPPAGRLLGVRAPRIADHGDPVGLEVPALLAGVDRAVAEQQHAGDQLPVQLPGHVAVRRAEIA